MQPLEVKRDSWHYWLAKKGDLAKATDYGFADTDICQYTRCALKGALLVLLVTAVAAWFTAALGNVLAAAVVMIQHHMWIPPDPWAGVPIAFALMAGTIVGCVVGFVWLNEKRRDRPETPPGFVKLAYRSFKGKYCLKIKFK